MTESQYIVIVYKNDMVCLHYVVIFQIAGVPLEYEELDEIRARLGAVAPHLVRYGDVEPANFFALAHKLVKVRDNVLLTHHVHLAMFLCLEYF